MLDITDLLGIKYSFLEGPYSLNELNSLGDNLPDKLNCQRLFQLASKHLLGKSIDKDTILLPQGYHILGKEVMICSETIDWEDLQYGDIIYASRLSESKEIKRKYPPEIRKHIAMYIGSYERKKHCILHASVVDGGSCVVSWEDFCRSYKPELIRRLP
jgi:hypothetical protein